MHQNSDLGFHFRSHRLISPPSASLLLTKLDPNRIQFHQFVLCFLPDRDGNEKLKTDAVAESAPEFEPTVVVAAVYAS